MTKFRARISITLMHSDSSDRRTFDEVIISTIVTTDGMIEVAAFAPAHPKGNAHDTSWCKIISSERP